MGLARLDLIIDSIFLTAKGESPKKCRCLDWGRKSFGRRDATRLARNAGGRELGEDVFSQVRTWLAIC